MDQRIDKTLARDRVSDPVRAGRSAGSDGHVWTTGRLRPHLPAALHLVASLLWLPQAGLIAWTIGGLVLAADMRMVFWQATAFLFIGVVRSLAEATGLRLAFIAARGTLCKKRVAAAQALAAMSPLDNRRPASAKAASVVAEQAEMIVPYLARFRPARLRAIVMPLVIVACILPFSWLAACVLLLAAPVIPLFMVLIGWRAQQASEKQLVETGNLNAFLLDRLRGLATLRSLGAIGRTADRLAREAESLRIRTMAVLRIAFLSSAVLELFAALGVALTAAYIGLHLLGMLDFGTWGGRLTLAEGLFVLLLAPAVFEPLRDLAAVWHDRAAGEAALDEIDRLAEHVTTLPEANVLGAGVLPAAPRFPRSKSAPSIVFRNVAFRYAGAAHDALHGIDLIIGPGEKVALFSPSGGGKSTVLALLAGLVSPRQGTVLVGDEAMTGMSAHALRRRMAWIGQKPYFLAGSMETNVAVHRDGIDRTAVREILADVGLGAIVRDRGHGMLGEAGAGLSGGQALRLALARAIADPACGVILADEPTAHLDRETAADITNLICSFARGRTLVVATHDPVLAARMDRVIRMDQTGEGKAA